MPLLANVRHLRVQVVEAKPGLRWSEAPGRAEHRAELRPAGSQDVLVPEQELRFLVTALRNASQDPLGVRQTASPAAICMCCGDLLFPLKPVGVEE